VTDHTATPNAAWSGDNPDPATSRAPYRLYNIGNNSPVQLGHMLAVLEEALGRTARKRMLDMQPGDVAATFADVDDLERDVGFRPATSIEEGVRRFVNWYLDYYRAERLASTA
jgi:UDP-glucuronate 4-epimerase